RCTAPTRSSPASRGSPPAPGGISSSSAACRSSTSPSAATGSSARPPGRRTRLRVTARGPLGLLPVDLEVGVGGRAVEDRLLALLGRRVRLRVGILLPLVAQRLRVAALRR